ncbi:hypothetical protein MC885_016624 [Smutsia gigantea]|nr:hypothetical protein MC885_016624 [Smutsia gigantea]
MQVQLLEVEVRENLRKLRDSEITLTRQLRSLSKVIGQIKSMCQNLILTSFENVTNHQDWDDLLFPRREVSVSISSLIQENR